MIGLLNGNSLHIPLADESVHCVVASPPYWGLRDYGISDQLGLEPTPDEYVANMVAVFRELWRVLRKDGTVWLVIGDSYNGSGGAGGDYNEGGLKDGQPRYPGRMVSNLKPKDLVGIPWRVAFALQGLAVVPFYSLADWAAILEEAIAWHDWELVKFVRDQLYFTSLWDRIDLESMWLRSDIIWHKPNPMPESVTDRPTKAHEYVFLLTKSSRYFYDADAISKPAVYAGDDRGARSDSRSAIQGANSMNSRTGATRNRRTVWTVTTKPYSGAHFATYPPDLIQPCIKAGTSERGVCPECGAPWERVVSHTYGGLVPSVSIGKDKGNPHKGGDTYRKKLSSQEVGWLPTCDHYKGDPIPKLPDMPDDAEPPEICENCGGAGMLDLWGFAEGEQAPCSVCRGKGMIRKPNSAWVLWQKETAEINEIRASLLDQYADYDTTRAIVFDPFAGSGTTVMTARDLGRSGVGLDLSLKYLRENARVRLGLTALSAWENGIDGSGEVDDLPLFMNTGG